MQQGRVFLSYQRSRSDEIDLLSTALRVVGLRTWRDVEDLSNDPTESELRRVLADPSCSMALLYITPEVRDSQMIRRVEAPISFERAIRDPGFAVVPVLAGGVTFAEVDGILGPNLGGRRAQDRNLLPVSSDPLNLDDARRVARTALRWRLEQIVKVSEGARHAPLLIDLSTWESGHSAAHLVLDWSKFFSNNSHPPTAMLSRRCAPTSAWNDWLIPALRDVADALSQAGLRRLTFSGAASLSAAFAAGVTFRLPGDWKAGWRQNEEEWLLPSSHHEPVLNVEELSTDVNSEDLAVLISVTGSVRNGFAEVQPRLRLRTAISFEPFSGPEHGLRLSANEAQSAAEQIAVGIHRAREQKNAKGAVHVFLEGPKGLAFLLGTQMNKIGRVIVYEYDGPPDRLRYVKGVELSPSS